MRALAPEHLEDLHRSGLSDATIDALRFAAVRPQDIKIKGVESAYELPYFNLDGSVNCFTRRRLFPPITHPDGSTQKYDQAKGTAPSLYLPPSRDWVAVAAGVRRTITFVEGEKKAAALCGRELNAIGIAGVWNWRQRLETGEALVIPTLDQFIWQGRTVELVPDSDVWRPEKQQALCGFYALAHVLLARGTTVRLIQLPDGGMKVGPDDWVVAAGADWVHRWPQLVRLALDDVRLAPVAAWWQKWKEKQATHDALKSHDLDDLALTESAGLYTVHAPTQAVTILFDRLTDARGSVCAEVTVSLGTTELLSGVDVGLKSDAGQSKLAGSLKAVAASVPWKLILQKACSLVLKRHRHGEPPTRLTKDSPVEQLTYAVNPLVFKKKTTIVYGDGGLGKSTWALFCAMVVSTGGPMAGIAAVKGRALFLDYEDDADVHTRRLHAIQAGHPDLIAATILYQRCVEPLTKLVYPLVRRIHDEGITFVVLDSLMASTGGDSSAEGTAKLFAALRLLNCEVLALGHVPKTQPEGQDRTTVYGSVFNQNFARSVWELKKEQEVGEDTAILGLFNRKSNLSRLHLPIGLKVTQNGDNTRVVYEPYDLSQAAELATALPLPNRIRNLLEDGEPRSSKEIADELGAKGDSVKATLSKHRGTKWHMIGENRGAKWTVSNR